MKLKIDLDILMLDNTGDTPKGEEFDTALEEALSGELVEGWEVQEVKISRPGEDRPNDVYKDIHAAAKEIAYALKSGVGLDEVNPWRAIDVFGDQHPLTIREYIQAQVDDIYKVTTPKVKERPRRRKHGSQ